MNIREMNDELIKITFPPLEGQIISDNAYLFHNGKKGVLIDSGKFENSNLLREYLQEIDIEVTSIILSHYHGDHIGGYSTLPHFETVIGSDRYDEMLSCYRVLDEREKYIPSHQVSDKPFKMSLEGFDIQCFKTPGHSPCSIATVINNQYLHIGDMIIQTVNKESILPLVYFELIDDQMDSLSILSGFENLQWLLGHGEMNQDVETKGKLIQSQRNYIQILKETNGEATVEEALKNSEVDYILQSWHERNLPDE